MRLIARLKIAFYGRELSAAIKPNIDALAARANEISNECNAALAAAEALRTQVLASGEAPGSAQTNLNALQRVLAACDAHEARIHDLVAAFHELELFLLARIDSLTSLYRPSEAERARLFGEIDAIRRPATELHARFLQDFMRLERLWQQWSPASQRQEPHGAARKRA